MLRVSADLLGMPKTRSFSPGRDNVTATNVAVNSTPGVRLGSVGSVVVRLASRGLEAPPFAVSTINRHSCRVGWVHLEIPGERHQRDFLDLSLELPVRVTILAALTMILATTPVPLQGLQGGSPDAATDITAEEIQAVADAIGNRIDLQMIMSRI